MHKIRIELDLTIPNKIYSNVGESASEIYGCQH